MGDITPNPGSPYARQMGCTCPIEKNNYGVGFEDPPKFLISRGCPLHDTSKTDSQGTGGTSIPTPQKVDHLAAGIPAWVWNTGDTTKQLALSDGYGKWITHKGNPSAYFFDYEVLPFDGESPKRLLQRLIFRIENDGISVYLQSGLLDILRGELCSLS